MSLTKFDIVEGFKREVARLSAQIKQLDARKYTVQEHHEKGSTDITDKFRGDIAACALELDRLINDLNSLHVR